MMGPMGPVQPTEQPVPPAALEQPVGTNNRAITPVAAATARMVFLVLFDFIVVPFREETTGRCGQ